MKIYCMTIISTYFKPERTEGITKGPNLYNAISFENEWCVETQRHANTHEPETVRSGDYVNH